jgi:hypothetical protein
MIDGVRVESIFPNRWNKLGVNASVLADLKEVIFECDSNLAQIDKLTYWLSLNLIESFRFHRKSKSVENITFLIANISME